MISKEFSVAVMVSNARKSAAWYKKNLGLEINEDGHWVTAGPKGGKWKLHLCEGKPEPGNTGIALYAADLKKTVADLKKKGVKFAMNYTRAEWGEIAQIEDPDGNMIWISKGSP